MSSYNFAPSFAFNSAPNYNSCGYAEGSSNTFGMIQIPENVSYGMITPHYSPDTTVAITLRQFEKESKSQAEKEYDFENGTLPAPPPEDDPTIPPDTRKAHKKKRKVRSAIVSRRKTAIYLEKLESELETRDSMNATLSKNLDLYREVISDVRNKIDAMQHSVRNNNNNINNINNNNNNSNVQKHSPNHINKRMRSSYNQFQNSGRVKKHRRPSHHNQNHHQQHQHQQQQQQQQQQLNYYQQYQQQQQQAYDNEVEYSTPITEGSFIATDPITPPAEITPSPSSNFMNNNYNLSNNNNTVTDLFSTISAEEIGDTSLPSKQQPQQPQQQQQQFKHASEAEFSECSDQSPVMRSEVSSETFHDESIALAPGQGAWKQSFQSFHHNPLLM